MVSLEEAEYRFVVVLITYCNFSDNIENESKTG